MRRYHPDRDQTAEAGERARAVTAAYETLHNPDLRIDYDLELADARAVASQSSGGPGSERLMFALIGSAGMGLLALAYLNPFPAGEQAERQMGLRGAHQAARIETPPAAPCASEVNARLIKQELFARLAARRGPDAADYQRLVADSALRLRKTRLVWTSPDRRTVHCTAMVELDTPGSAAPSGDRSRLSSDIAFFLTSAEGGSRSLALSDEGTLLGDLAMLAPGEVEVEPGISTDEVDARPPLEPGSPQPVESRPSFVSPVEAPRVALTKPVPPPVARKQLPRTAPRVLAQPAKAGPRISGLDQSLGALFGQSVRHADPVKRRALYRDHYRFIARLDRCSSEACSRAEYLKRMREINGTITAPAAVPRG
jgi:hypothetical protein